MRRKNHRARSGGNEARMGAKGKLVLLPTLGGQTALNTAMALDQTRHAGTNTASK